MEVIPLDESYSNAPPSIVRPLLIVVVGLVFVWVLKVKSGVAVVEVANEKAYCLLERIVVVAAFK